MYSILYTLSWLTMLVCSHRCLSTSTAYAVIIHKPMYIYVFNNDNNDNNNTFVILVAFAAPFYSLCLFSSLHPNRSHRKFKCAYSMYKMLFRLLGRLSFTCFQSFGFKIFIITIFFSRTIALTVYYYHIIDTIRMVLNI